MANPKRETKQEPLLADLVVQFLVWFDKVNDEDDDCGYLNGCSDKYPGDGWDDLEKIANDLRAAIKPEAA